MDGFGAEDLFDVLDDKPSDKKKPEVKGPSVKKKITPEILGLSPCSLTLSCTCAHYINYTVQYNEDIVCTWKQYHPVPSLLNNELLSPQIRKTTNPNLKHLIKY